MTVFRLVQQFELSINDPHRTKGKPKVASLVLKISPERDTKNAFLAILDVHSFSLRSSRNHKADFKKAGQTAVWLSADWLLVLHTTRLYAAAEEMHVQINDALHVPNYNRHDRLFGRTLNQGNALHVFRATPAGAPISKAYLCRFGLIADSATYSCSLYSSVATPVLVEQLGIFYRARSSLGREWNLNVARLPLQLQIDKSTNTQQLPPVFMVAVGQPDRRLTVPKATSFIIWGRVDQLESSTPSALPLHCQSAMEIDMTLVPHSETGSRTEASHLQTMAEEHKVPMDDSDADFSPPQQDEEDQSSFSEEENRRKRRRGTKSLSDVLTRPLFSSAQGRGGRTSGFFKQGGARRGPAYEIRREAHLLLKATKKEEERVWGIQRKRTKEYKRIVDQKAEAEEALHRCFIDNTSLDEWKRYHEMDTIALTVVLSSFISSSKGKSSQSSPCVVLDSAAATTMNSSSS